MSRTERRFARQIARLQRIAPRLGTTLDPGSKLRIPIALVLILGGLLGFLPVLGFWMLPLGLLILAIDLKALRPLTASFSVRVRHWMRMLTRRWRARRWR